MKIYIAGAITNNPNYIEQFAAAEEKLKAEGHAVINPCKNSGFEYSEYIDMGLCELMRCDAIYLLKGYENSQGAKLELFYAVTTGKAIYSEGAIINIDIGGVKVKTITIEELNEIIDKAEPCEHCPYDKNNNCPPQNSENACKQAYEAYLTNKLCL